MKQLLLKLFNVENKLVDQQEETNRLLKEILKDSKRNTEALEIYNKYCGITKDHGYDVKY